MTANEFLYMPSGEIVATGVSEEEYLDTYAEHHCEWVNGTVIKLAPATDQHDELLRYGARLFEAYFELRPIGILRQMPFLMKLSTGAYREPDLMVILQTNSNKLTRTVMHGAADICVEVVSQESFKRDRGEKFEEYEKLGVGEYWVWDPLHSEARFYRLNKDGVYIPQPEDTDGNYRTPLLPGLVVHVPTLWAEKRPGPGAIARAIEAMLNG